jgi:hypothetical protein
VGTAGAVGSTGAIGVAAAGAFLAFASAGLGAVGPSDDRPGASGWPTGVAFAVQLDHDVGAQDGVLLVAVGPLVQLGR